ncbi:hypothetical protein GGR53DRAFT_469124 [Hypoxylon sp. FL1150]|nr:hypothetical protein GGR53DRAFT_469124 [Hypoxylon sp. FL1150]
MGTSSPPTASDPTTNSPSDLSYSSGVSRNSTRNTSPDPVVAVSSSHQALPLLDLNLNIDIEHTPNTLLERHPKMDRNPFQSVNQRRNKLATDRNSTHQIQRLQQAFQAPMLRPGMQPLNMPSRGVSSSNWRTAEDGSRSNDTTSMPFDPSIGHHTQQHGSGIRQPAYLIPMMDQYQHPNASYLVPGTFPEMQPDTSYAYCYDRGNGQYTRLVPVDMLPPLQDIPALQPDCSGMVVLPQPRAMPPEGRSSNAEPVMLKSPLDTPSSPSDNIQSRIDTIVASTPPTPTHLHSPMSPVGVVGLGPGSTATSVPGGHHHHHSHQQHGGGHGGGCGGGGGGGHGNQQPQRRPKIYCDKWVHEGVCAFTQQGCKYKHEMPFDKVTQHQLGLFHGFPAWWKKHQADLSRQRDGPAGNGAEGVGEPVRLSSDRFLGRGGGPVTGPGPSITPTPAGAAPLGGNGNGNGDPGVDIGPGPAGQCLPSWRRNGSSESHRASLAASRGMPARVGPSMRTPIVSYGSPFGPIAPPVRTPTTPGPHAGSMGDAAYAGSSQSQQMGENGNSVRPSVGIRTDNPYESLSMENNKGSYETKTEVAASSSNGAHLT